MADELENKGMNMVARSNKVTKCQILEVGKRRDGGTKYWCIEHHADATAKYGKRAANCRYAHIPPVTIDETLQINLNDYAGGVAVWGAVPPIYDTTQLPLDRGVHVHARRRIGADKDIDQTYQEIHIHGENGSQDAAIVKELDAIYFMVSSVFGFKTYIVKCTYCNFLHLDKDWFSVHPHKRHLCAGFGKSFRDAKISVGNPAVGVAQTLGRSIAKSKKSAKSLVINQSDYPGGIQIWGSNQAIVRSEAMPGESGIHVHAFHSNSTKADLDDTYSKVTIDGIGLNAQMVRTLMAQNALPHLVGRVVSSECPRCNASDFDKGEAAFTPRTERECEKCDSLLKPPGRLRKVIANPLVATLEKIAENAVRKPQVHDLGLIPETL
jgi:hypothetical protein